MRNLRLFGSLNEMDTLLAAVGCKRAVVDAATGLLQSTMVWEAVAGGGHDLLMEHRKHIEELLTSLRGDFSADLGW